MAGRSQSTVNLANVQGVVVSDEQLALAGTLGDGTRQACGSKLKHGAPKVSQSSLNLNCNATLFLPTSYKVWGNESLHKGLRINAK